MSTLHSPSARHRGGKWTSREEVTLNLVPMLDVLVSMITFLLLSMSFIAFVGIESPVPIAAPPPAETQPTGPILQLSISITASHVEIWSPFETIETMQIPHLAPGKMDLTKIHEALLGVKQKFPDEKKIVFLPEDGTNYDQLVALMDSARMLDPTDPPIFSKNAQSGVEEAQKMLFPDIVFGNIVGESG